MHCINITEIAIDMVNMEILLSSITREWTENRDQSNRVIRIAYRKYEKGIGKKKSEGKKKEKGKNEKNEDRWKRGLEIGGQLDD